MATGYSPSIDTDSLLCYIDGLNTKCFTGGTSGTDLITSSQFTLVNGITHSSSDGSFSLDGSNDYIDIFQTTPASLLGNTPFSVAGWFKKSGSWSGGATWGIGGSVSVQGINSWNSGYTDNISIDLWGRTTFTTGATYSLDEWKFVCWTYNGTTFYTDTVSIYVNDVIFNGSDFQVIRGSSIIPNINSNGVCIGRAGRSTAAYHGKPVVSCFLLYAKELNQFEVEHIFNSTRSRFGV